MIVSESINAKNGQQFFLESLAEKKLMLRFFYKTWLTPTALLLCSKLQGFSMAQNYFFLEYFCNLVTFIHREK